MKAGIMSSIECSTCNHNHKTIPLLGPLISVLGFLNLKVGKYILLLTVHRTVLLLIILLLSESSNNT